MSSATAAAASAPNVVAVVLDDLGFAQIGSYGSDIATPAMDQLAANGVRYNNFHVTALCSPTRAALLTGRNHHAVGMGFLADIPTNHRGYSARVPPSATTLPRILRDAGWSTLAVGKWHLTPRGERSAAGPFDRWPLGFGFERYYGFLRGDTNQWAPELVRDNSFVEAPARPEDGYHLTEDLADEAIDMVLTQQACAPGKPFFLYFAPGAMHAPHHVERSWSDAYRGQFDDGWDRWREEAFARQLDSGLIPAGTELTPRPPWVPSWQGLSAEQRRLFARAHEVYAGFLSHTDAQIGRIVAALERIGQLNNTLILLMSDNGASAEGGVHGTVNEHRFSHRVGDDLAANMARLEEWGGRSTYPHYPWGWAWAGNTPFRLWKRYSWLGGTRVPLIVHHPDRIGSGGAVRRQFGHVVDVMPTVLDVCGISVPAEVDGVAQMPLHGASLSATLTDGDAPAPRSTQYFEMLGSRAMVAAGWKATTDHVAAGVVDEEELMLGSHEFDTDRWALFNLADDFSEAHDVADQHPDVVEHLQELWAAEAARHNVLPLADSLLSRIAAGVVAPAHPPGDRVVLYPDAGPLSDEALPLLAAGGRILAEVDVPETANGVVFAFGDCNGGLAAYAIDGQLTVAMALPGFTETVTVEQPLSPGRHRLGCSVQPTGEHRSRLDVLIDERVAGTVSFGDAIPFAWQHGGTRLTVGYARGLPVTQDYQPPFAWNGGVSHVVVEGAMSAAPSEHEAQTALRVD